MIFESQASLETFAKKIGENLEPPFVFELIGDVGAGKTTFTRALAKGLGIKSSVTSPSFSISNRYSFSKNSVSSELIHYDFYRLDDPGLMSFELSEALENPNSVVVIEWGDSIKNLLPNSKETIHFSVLEDGSRELIFSTERFAPKSLKSQNSLKSSDSLASGASKISESSKSQKKEKK